jgi:hypothetical protein
MEDAALDGSRYCDDKPRAADSFVAIIG